MITCAESVHARDTGVADQRRVRAILVARRTREVSFDADLFADPAWDILLELYLARLGQFDLSVTSLCMGSAVPQTTALRWINEMEKRGLLLRRRDPTDGRRIFVSLSKEATQQMAKLLCGAPSRESLI